MAVNAAWPGVSMKVMRPCPGVSTPYAPMCWVMPPASPAVTRVLRMYVEQRRLAVVDVAHHRDHRRARLFFALDVEGANQRLLHGVGMDGLRPVAHLLDHQNGRVLVHRLVDGGHDAHAHQRLDHFAGLDRHAAGQLADRDRFGNLDFPGNEIRRSELAPMLRRA
jgi:hypothetical protein